MGGTVISKSCFEFKKLLFPSHLVVVVLLRQKVFAFCKQIKVNMLHLKPKVQFDSYRFRVNGSHTSPLKAKKGLRQDDPISPMLFVIIMEYLQHILKDLNFVPDFNFHPRCEKLGIINLSLADDLLFFKR